eukprot:1194930-Prorocentrum_minimum.AAC.2
MRRVALACCRSLSVSYVNTSLSEDRRVHISSAAFCLHRPLSVKSTESARASVASRVSKCRSAHCAGAQPEQSVVGVHRGKAITRPRPPCLPRKPKPNEQTIYNLRDCKRRVRSPADDYKTRSDETQHSRGRLIDVVASTVTARHVNQSTACPSEREGPGEKYLRARCRLPKMGVRRADVLLAAGAVDSYMSPTPPAGPRAPSPTPWCEHPCRALLSNRPGLTPCATGVGVCCERKRRWLVTFASQAS